MGQTDVKYLKLLKKLAVGNAPAAREARDFLLHAAKDASLVYPHDSKKAGQLRDRAIELILKLQKK